jgi:hypothetical protein
MMNYRRLAQRWHSAIKLVAVNIGWQTSEQPVQLKLLLLACNITVCLTFYGVYQQPALPLTKSKYGELHSKFDEGTSLSSLSAAIERSHTTFQAIVVYAD